MPNYPQRHWQRRWTVSEDGCTATHLGGLIARFDGANVAIDDASRETVYAAFAADPLEGRYANAKMVRLVREAYLMFREVLPARRARQTRRDE